MPSVGEAAALGLDRGMRLALDITERQRNQERQERLEQRQSRQDVIQADALARSLKRQGQQDQLAALAAQEAQLKGELEAAGPNVPANLQADYTARAQGLSTAKQGAMAEMGGYDHQKFMEEAVQSLQSGDLSKLKPGQFTLGATKAAMRPLSDYMREGGKPSPIESATEQFKAAMAAGEEEQIIESLNVLQAGDLNKRRGMKSRHGGTITGAKIVGVIPDKNSPKDDPRVIPTIRIFVNSGKNFRGPIPEGVPEGTTGWYDAPPTEGMDSSDNAKVRSVGMREFTNYLQKQQEMVELLNSPEGQQLLQADAASGWDFDRARASVGVAPPKFTTQRTIIPQGAVALEETFDARGNKVKSERIQGEPKQGELEKKLEAIKTAPNLTPQQRAIEERAVRSGIKPGKYTGDGLAVSSGKSGGSGKSGSSGGPGLSAAENRQLTRQQASLNTDRADIKERRRIADEDYKRELDKDKPDKFPSPDEREAYRKRTEEAKKTRDEEIKKLDEQDNRIKGKITEIDKRLGLADATGEKGEKAKPAALPKSKSELKSGAIYQTSRGPARWNGTAFEAQ